MIQNLVRILRDEAIRRDVRHPYRARRESASSEVDRVQIEQVLLNLAINGMDAMVGIQASRELSIASSSHAAEEILIRVEDRGAGSDPETAKNIFDPFFTTKLHGIGMGLSISRSIIEAHDGKLWASPVPLGARSFNLQFRCHS